ncbi:hypothetical protein PsAD2_02866 [Pseudovibrio axinellae]|uniref:DUF4345 domain-containing protein n=1 Tax=Pseudovibrio axinellae TaxID=989403 RepID=A0A165XMQ3_9HYPH|nr:DUF4345 domain-containing protein [Pseudovibrio axinellae]KZL17864.1 hypothetical protein PsAD2_02866 [Pseudovibrio axinellae]SER86123.1 protein of unknown function [Pseudovibrio axinellae]
MVFPNNSKSGGERQEEGARSIKSPQPLTRFFLIAAAIGLFPIALSYGAAPQMSLTVMFGFENLVLDHLHIFRAIMGLYFAMLIFWLAGAFNTSVTIPALWTLIVFMWGLAAGRLLSMVLDGIPSFLLMVYLLLEIAFGLIAVMLVTKEEG